MWDRNTHPPAEPDSAPPVRRALISLDPGWLFLISGIAIIAAVVLIPAQHDLEDARWQRDRAVSIEQHRIERLERYGRYLAAAKSGDECVLLSLGATQLNVTPADRVPLLPTPDVSRTSASVFPSLEPGPLRLPNVPRDRDLSMLERLTVNNTTRLWLIAAGVMCVLFGLLPETSRAAAGAIGGVAASGLAFAGDVIAEAKVKHQCTDPDHESDPLNQLADAEVDVPEAAEPDEEGIEAQPDAEDPELEPRT